MASHPESFGQTRRPRRRGRLGNSAKLCVEQLEDRWLMSADAVLDWNTVAINALKNDYDAAAHAVDQPGPTRTSRAMAIISVAVYDAVAAIDNTTMPYLVSFHAAPGTSINVAVAQAAHDTLSALFPHQKATFDAALSTSLAGVTSNAAALGEELGRKIAKAVLAARAGDGASGPMDYTPGTLPGQYRPDPLHPNQMFVGPDWKDVTPFVMTSATQFPAAPPPALNSQAYTDAYNQVKSLGGNGTMTPTSRTAEQTEIGIFWGYDGMPGLGTPTVAYNEITQVIAKQQGNSEVQNARLLAMTNVAMADAGVAAWTTKYTYNLWRPVTAIRESDPGTGPTGLGDGNANTVGDANWTPLGAQADNGSGTDFTPAFPSYDSGHAVFGAALFGTLRNFYGTDHISFAFTSDEFNGVTRDSSGNVRPVVTRSYSSLSQAAEENGISRVYLGVHWSFDVSAALAQGGQIADYDARHFAIPVPSQRSFMASHVYSPAGNSAAALLAAQQTVVATAVDHALASTSFQLAAPLAQATSSAFTPLMQSPAQAKNLTASSAAAIAAATQAQLDPYAFLTTPGYRKALLASGKTP